MAISASMRPLPRLRSNVCAAALEVDRLRVDDLLAAVDVLDKFDDAAGEAIGVRLAVSARPRTWIVTPGLRKASSRKRVDSVSKLNSTVVKIVGSGLKRTLVPDFFERAEGLERALGDAAVDEAEEVHLPVALHFRLEPLGEERDDGDTDAVQTAGELVGVLLELAAGVRGRSARPRAWTSPSSWDPCGADGDAAAVVGDRDGVVEVELEVDAVARVPAIASSMELSTTSYTR
jgi:hypothetical protein